MAKNVLGLIVLILEISEAEVNLLWQLCNAFHAIIAHEFLDQFVLC